MFTYQEVCDILRPLLLDAKAGGARCFRAVSNDSRTAQPGDLFVALRTEHRDGHEFVRDAIAHGATGAIVERDVSIPEGAALLRVRDTWQALGDLAAAWRSRFDVRVIGITGNVGKTTTKELAAAVLGGKYRVLKSPANFNDEAGLSMTLFQLDREHERAVVELGMYRLGEIRRLCAIARPAVGVVTNVGPTHVERLGSIEAIADAKAELVESLPEDGTAILNGDDPRVRAMAQRTRARALLYGSSEDCDVRASEVEGRGLDGVSFTLHWRGESRRMHLAPPGRALVTNAAAAAAVGLTEGMSLAEVGDALEQAEIDVRMRVVHGKNGATILDDTYNAGPASMAAALDLLGELPGRKIAVLGDMRELGALAADAHAAVGRQAADVADVIDTVGDLGRLMAEAAQAAGHAHTRHWPDKASLAAALQRDLRADDVVLLKASRALALETLVEGLAE